MSDKYDEKYFYTLEVFKAVLGTLGRDFVTEDVIRDTKKIVEQLFSE